MKKSKAALVFLALLQVSVLARAGDDDDDDDSDKKPKTPAAAAAKPAPATAAQNLLNLSCPFKKQPASVNDLVNQVKSALTAFEGKDCAGAAQAAKQMNAVLTGSLQNALQSNVINPVTGASNAGGDDSANAVNGTNCLNYQQNLRLDYSLAGNIQSISANAVPPEFQSCTTASDGNANTPDVFRQCTSQIYVQQLQAYQTNCKSLVADQARSLRNQNIGSQISAMAQSAQQLVQLGSQCRDGAAKQMALQTGLNTLSTIGAFAPGIGLAGAGIAAMAGLADSIIDKYFNQNSAAKNIEMIRSQEMAQDESCVFYLIEKQALHCGVLMTDGSNLSSSRQCDAGVTAMGHFSRTLTDVGDALAAYSSDKGEARLDDTDKIFNTLTSRKGLDPVTGNKVPFDDYLSQVQKALAADTGPNAPLSSAREAQNLGKFLKAYGDLNSERKNPDKLKKFQDTFDDLGGGAKLNDMIARYWTLKGKTAELDHLQTLAGVMDDVKTGDAAMNEMRLTIGQMESDAGARAVVDPAHTGFINTRQKNMLAQLKISNDKFESNRGREERDIGLQDLVPVAQNCILNAAAYFYQRGTVVNKSQNEVAKAAPDEYTKACSKFSCINPLFDPKSSRAPAQDLRRYQCIDYLIYGKALKQVSDQFMKDGKVCGQ